MEQEEMQLEGMGVGGEVDPSLKARCYIVEKRTQL